MGWQGSNAELCRVYWAQNVQLRMELHEAQEELKEKSEAIDSALWACNHLDDLTREELAFTIEATFRKWA